MSHSMPRLNRIFSEINIVLVAIAIGLAVLDFTCFVALTAFREISRAQAATASPAFARNLGNPAIEAKSAQVPSAGLDLNQSAAFR